ncbi:hypothetical protein ACP_2460 [Acidobacterium capsulatum ATCC 51196]|uniref:DUF2007 domain-containing protein n=2 Tax=Acidobacteriaceae TaxID=204434 RepID=C1F1F3_ACIC5|nr:hypothetical protein ACP_2460 [Acidobacterium capsulatum ATCC 51196]
MRAGIARDQCEAPWSPYGGGFVKQGLLILSFRHPIDVCFQSEEGKDIKMADDIVTIAEFNEPLEAEMARLRLQSAGIEVFLSGENARIMEPGLGPLQLQVPAADAEDARAILNDPGAANEAEAAEQQG